MNRTALAVVSDLFFVAKLQGTARASGVTLVTATLVQAVAKCDETRPDIVLIDLHEPGDLEGLIAGLKQATTAPLIGFYSHVDGDTRRRALAAGIDQALPRSAFVTRLPALLSGESSSPETPETTP